MKPLIFTQNGKRIATLTPQEGKVGEVFTLGSAAKCDVVVSAEHGLAPQQVSFSPVGSVWWIGDMAADGRLEVNGRRTAADPVVSTAHVKVGSFEFDVSCEASEGRKTRREVASDILYSHALASLSRNLGDSTSADETELEGRIGSFVEELLSKGTPELAGLDESVLADLKRETIE